MPDPSTWSAAAQRRRFADLAAFIRQRLRSVLQPDGSAGKLIWWDQPRVELWAANAFLVGDADDAAFGNTILRHVRDTMDVTPSHRPFEASACAGLLAGFPQALADDTKGFLQEFLVGCCEFGITRDYQFHGYNDNMPVMWTWAHLYAGESYDRPDLLRIARANLHQLADLFRRRGAVAEYGSGYATHRLTGLAHIGEHARDPVLRQLARDCEARVWAEHAGHWHPGLGMICGASMRGTHIEATEPNALFQQVFGETVAKPWMPQRELFDQCEHLAEMGLDPDEYLFAYPFGYAAEFASAIYHVPDEIAELFAAKELPARFAGTAECGHVHEGIFRRQEKVYGEGGAVLTSRFTDDVVEIEDYPQHGAQPHQLVTWHGRNFALGTSSTNMFTTSYAARCSYRRTPEPSAQADLGAGTMRYNINGKLPGGRTVNTYPKSPDLADDFAMENYCRLYRDQGRHACLQHENTVLCLSTPEWREWWQVHELRLDFVLLQLHGAVRHWERSADGTRIDFDEGATYLSLRPLVGRHLERSEAIRVRTIDEWLVVSAYNYEGPERSFGKREIAKLGNGFVLEMRDAGDYPDFAAFQAELDQARVLDQLYAGRRRVHYAREGLRLSMHYCPYVHTVMQASVNGLERPVEQLSFGDGREQRLPFMDGRPAPGFEDWEWLTTQISRPCEPYNPQD